ncbi:MAG: endonuclease III domain-containing protein [Nitrospiria bacterium]
MYERLYAHFGPQHWWPADSPFEVIVGAVLTQNTAWANVEKAIAQLRKSGLLTPEAIQNIPESELAKKIRPSGFFNLKARRLKNVAAFIFGEYGGSLERMFSEATPRLREKLLAVKGLGPETVDSILLYAGEKPVFVVDAYTRRIFFRHRWIASGADYAAIQALFMTRLPHDAPLFNEYHALIVKTAKVYCRKTADCAHCPLRVFPAYL